MEEAQQATIEAAHIQAAATLVAAKISGSMAKGNAKAEIDIVAEFEAAWVAVGHGIRKGKKALAVERKSAKAEQAATT